MTTLADFGTVPPEDPARPHTVTVSPTPIRNWPLAISTALECCGKYGHALLTSNGSEDRPATLWLVAREVS